MLNEELFNAKEECKSILNNQSNFASSYNEGFKNGFFEDGEDAATSNNVLRLKMVKYFVDNWKKVLSVQEVKGFIYNFNDFGFKASSEFC